MADRSAIEWTDASWNCLRARLINEVGDKAKGAIGWHCEHVTEGCAHCYAERMNHRLGTGLPFKPGHRKDIEIFLDENMLQLPLRWKKPRKIFAFSMTDPFADFVTDKMLDKIFAIMALSPQHTFQVLTKRAGRMRDYCTSAGRADALARANAMLIAGFDTAARHRLGVTSNGKRLLPLPNVWLGVSCERQQEADERIPLLLQTPAAVRFISAEPLLGPIDLNSLEVNGDATCDALRPDTYEAVWEREWKGTTGNEADERAAFLDWFNLSEMPTGEVHPGIDWVIAGGESGPKARPMHPDWARSLRDQCKAAGVAFYFKQHGEWIGVPDLRQLPGGTGPGFGTFDYCRYDEEHECVRVGKAMAGRLLDGVEHNEFPKVGG